MDASARKIVHGGLDLAEALALGLDPSRVIDFSASINPLGPPEAARTALSKVDLAAYPDRQCAALRRAMARRLGLGVDWVHFGNGSTEIIHCLARAFLGPGKTACVFAPTFAEYEVACALAGAAVQRVVASEAQGFSWDEEDAPERIRRVRPAVVFVCNPNNPTGALLGPGSVEAIACATDGGLLVLDEAYMPFADAPWDARFLLSLGNVALLRSMTKDFGLAGLRLGYLLAPPLVIEEARRFQPSWSVNSLAQAAALAALDCDGHVQAARRVIAAGKEYLLGRLHDLGAATGPSRANFVLARVGEAARVRRRLLERGLCVRDCASFGLPEHIRIGVRRLEDCRRLMSEMEGVLAHG